MNASTDGAWRGQEGQSGRKRLVGIRCARDVPRGMTTEEVKEGLARWKMAYSYFFPSHWTAMMRSILKEDADGPLPPAAATIIVRLFHNFF